MHAPCSATGPGRAAGFLLVEVLITLSCESRQEVDDLVAKAIAAGGSTHDKAEDLGFMYSHSFLDPDGHGWGVMHMTAPKG